ncbi:hypothetical protein [Agaribacterium haliotis]|uniref:hypothetical protein n=1 Tax=Agaribacterium haliotis TaxID=2013869 RepID=UPI000BB58ADE|nr:hypothetical protein [Agaribacterium haliotis]
MSPTQEQTSELNQAQHWNHVRETVNMLYLAICQIEATLSDSNLSVQTLTNSFTNLANHTQSISQQAQQLKAAEEVEAFKVDIRDTTAELQCNISASIQAFQFYDRVCQRLEHVSSSLEKVSSLLESDKKLEDPQAWAGVQQQIKSSYTMEAERIMFEYLMRGGSVKEALDIYKHHFEKEQNENSANDDEIELF